MLSLPDSKKMVSIVFFLHSGAAKQSGPKGDIPRHKKLSDLGFVCRVKILYNYPGK